MSAAVVEEPGEGPSRSGLPPGPEARSGRLRQRLQQVGLLLDPLGTVAGRFARYGDLYHVASDDGGLWVARHPEHLREVLVTRASSYSKKHTGLRQLARVLGDGLLTSDGASWQRQRRMVQPAFGRARMEGYARVMTEEARAACGAWRPGERLELSHAMMELTLRVVARTLFGHDATGDIQAVSRAMKTFQAELSRPELLPPWVPSPGRWSLRRATETLDGVIRGMIAKRRGQRRDAEAPDLLGILLDARDTEGDGEGLTGTELRDQLVTLFLAGHETTSHALSWTFYLLSQNPSAERALHDELSQVLGGRAPTLSDLDALPYTEQVLKESLRLFPPVYLVIRQAVEETVLGGYRVPAGAEVALWVYHTHRDPRWYPDHGSYRPERFARGEEEKLPRMAWVPFGAGPRACIGRAFAMMEARLLLATIAQRYRLALVPGHAVEPLPRITLVPRHGLPMVPTPRA